MKKKQTTERNKAKTKSIETQFDTVSNLPATRYRYKYICMLMHRQQQFTNQLSIY